MVYQRNRKWEGAAETKRVCAYEYVPTIEFDEYVTQEGHQVEKVFVAKLLKFNVCERDSILTILH